MRLRSKRIVVPQLDIDFTILAQDKDKDQFDKFWNIILSMWDQLDKGSEIKVFDHVSELEK